MSETTSQNSWSNLKNKNNEISINQPSKTDGQTSNSYQQLTTRNISTISNDEVHFMIMKALDDIVIQVSEESDLNEKKKCFPAKISNSNLNDQNVDKTNHNLKSKQNFRIENSIVRSLPDLSKNFNLNQIYLNKKHSSSMRNLFKNKSNNKNSISQSNNDYIWNKSNYDYEQCDNQFLSKLSKHTYCAHQHKPNQSKHFNFNSIQHKPLIQFQRSLSRSVALLNSFSVPNSYRFSAKSCASSSLTNKNFDLNKIKTKQKLNSNQTITMIFLSILAFISQCSVSIIAPFFPLESANKGVTESISGMIFSVHAFTVMISGPFVGHFTTKIGAKPVLLTGILICGIAQIAFGTLDYVMDTTIFTVLCFIVRITEAFGTCAFSTVSYIYIMNEFPNDIGWAFSLLETFVGLGMSLGPGIGGLLYNLGGYSLPFYFLGVCILIIFPVASCILNEINLNDKNSSEEEDEDNQTDETQSTIKTLYQSINLSSNSSITNNSHILTNWKLIKIPNILIIALVIIVISQSQGFLDPTIEPHLRTYGAQPWVVGFVFLIMSTAYAVCSPLVGWIASKVDNKFIIMLIGLIITLVGLILVGPSHVISHNPDILFSVFGMLIIGIGFAVAFIPTFETIFIIVTKDFNFEDNLQSYSVVSGLWGSMFALGEVIGPTIGGILSEFLDFPTASSFMAVVCLITIIVVFITVVCIEIKKKKRSRSISNNSYINSIYPDNLSETRHRSFEFVNYQKNLISSKDEKLSLSEKSYLLG